MLLPDLFCRGRAKTRTGNGGRLQACCCGCPQHCVLAGNMFWGVLLHPSACCTTREKASCIPCPASHTPYSASCTPHPISRILHPTSRIPCPASHTPYPAPCTLHPAWDPKEGGAGALPGGTGCTPLVLGKSEGSQAALITSCPACSAQSQQKAQPPVSRKGPCSGAGRSQAPGFMPALRKTTLSVWTGQHPRGAACPAPRARDRDTPPL